MQKIDYQKKLDGIIENLNGKAPTLLLHSCCAPCSSYCIEYLSQYFHITIYYYNPNILEAAEYQKRMSEVQRLLGAMETKYPVSFLEGEYCPEDFLLAVKGLEEEPEGGARCPICYQLRMREAAKVAKKESFDYFTTTLSISPHKNAAVLNAIGEKLEEELGVKYLYADFKKREGYKRSIALSKELNLYRQDYCGCAF